MKHSDVSGPFAEQCFRVEIAAARIVQHSVLDAIQRVALVVDRVRQDMNLAGWDVAVAIHRQRDPEMAANVVVRPVVGRVARDDAVEIGRIPLRFDHRFVSALGASTEIGVRRLRAVKRPQDHFVGFGHQMRRPIGKIHDAFVIS